MQIAFSTESPAVLDAWTDILGRIQIWRDEIHAFADERGSQPMSIQRTGSLDFVGLTADNAPSNGWRMDSKWNFWVPNRKTAEGRRLHDQMEKLTVKGTRTLPGMPDIAFHNGRWYEARLGELGTTMWAGWGCTLDVLRENTWSATKLDEAVWQQRPLSHFYAAEESYRAAHV